MKKEGEYLYSKLANILREQIISGYIRPGEFILSENQLSEYYELSRVSVRKSLEILLNEGLIVKKVGQGTIVSPDLVIPKNEFMNLNIVATSPSNFIDTAMHEIIHEFNKKFPNVKVNVISVPRNFFYSSLANITSRGIKPDLFFVGDEQINIIHSNESFRNLNDVILDSGCNQMVYKKFKDYFYKDDEIFAVPITFSTVYLVYNEELFKKYNVAIPHKNWTIDDFINTASKLTLDTNGDDIDDQYGFSISLSLTRWLTIALQNEVNFKNHEVDITSLAKTLDFIHDILYRRRIAILCSDYNNVSNPFFFQHSAMTLATSMEIAGWKNQHIGFSPKVAYLPFGDKKPTMLIANCLMVPSACSSFEMAQSFIKTALSVDIQNRISSNYDFLSVLKPINEKVWDKNYLKSLNVLNQLENGSFIEEIFPEPNVLSEVETEMGMFWQGFESSNDTALRLKEII